MTSDGLRRVLQAMPTCSAAPCQSHHPTRINRATTAAGGELLTALLPQNCQASAWHSGVPGVGKSLSNAGLYLIGRTLRGVLTIDTSPPYRRLHPG